ncbi:MAG: right-handed parallel beta-helix repeat-containing protein [Akkermansiaceae bacterium]|nr:right-handed parallel beta-helix repeat-containing protein [Akkermansiaceae bacterium]
MITDWYSASVVGGSPGSLQTFSYPEAGVTRIVAGTLSGSESWSGKILVVGDLTITGSLTIDPGTEVVFEHLHDTQASGLDTSRSELILQGGSFTAIGTAATPIVFTSSGSPEAPSDWYGIRVLEGDVTMDHCRIEYAVQGIRFEDTDTRFDTYSLSNVTVRACSDYGIWTGSGADAEPVVLTNFQITQNEAGIYANGPLVMAGGTVNNNEGIGVTGQLTDLVFDGVLVTLNGDHGIKLYRGSATVTGSNVTHNTNDGIYSDEGNIDLSGSVFSNNGGWGVNGDWYLNGSLSARFSEVVTGELDGNTIQSNGSGGVRCYYSGVVGLTGNVISGNSGTGLLLALNDTDGTAGISPTGITGNSIFGNGGVGVHVSGPDPAVITLSGNDIYDNTDYEIKNESPISITAENVYLGKETATEFGVLTNLTRIYDQQDRPEYGQVNVVSLNTGTMLLPPEITTQPVGVTVNLGQNVTLTVAATGSDPITYQWYRNGSPVPQATGSSLQLVNMDIGKAGQYHVVVTNWAGSVASDIAAVGVIIPPDTTPSEPVTLGLGKFYGYTTVALRGEVGRAYTLQVSEDLIHWDNLVIFTLTGNPQTQIDWGSLDRPQRFYRAVWNE